MGPWPRHTLVCNRTDQSYECGHEDDRQAFAVVAAEESGFEGAVESHKRMHDQVEDRTESSQNNVCAVRAQVGSF